MTFLNDLTALQTKVDTQIGSWILSLRKARKLGARRIQNELLREHNCHLSLATIHKTLTKNQVKPGSPHLNGKVERSQRTDKEEFYSTTKLDFHELQTKTLPEWQHYYNWQRAHDSFKGKTPMDVVCEHLDKIPIWEDVSREYKPDKERIQLSNYQGDLQFRKLKPSL